MPPSCTGIDCPSLRQSQTSVGNNWVNSLPGFLQKSAHVCSVGLVMVSPECHPGRMCPDAVALTMKLFSTGGLSICLLVKQRRGLDHSSKLLNLLIRFPYHVLPGSIQANVVQSLPPEHAQMYPLGKECVGNSWDAPSGT